MTKTTLHINIDMLSKRQKDNIKEIFYRQFPDYSQFDDIVITSEGTPLPPLTLKSWKKRIKELVEEGIHPEGAYFRATLEFKPKLRGTSFSAKAWEYALSLKCDEVDEE